MVRPFRLQSSGLGTLALIYYLLALASTSHGATDRFVWIFGWGLDKDSDVSEISKVLETAGKHGFNGAVFSSGLDTLCKQTPDYFRRLEGVQRACQTNGLELIPGVFSIGYGGGVLGHDRNLAEGLLVEDAPFVAKDGMARLTSSGSDLLVNGGFEESAGNRIKKFDFHDQPGEVSFVDKEIKHSGEAALRLENFTANPHGHGRVMQTIAVQPHRCYRLSLWIKTEDLRPKDGFQLTVLAGERDLAPRRFDVPATTDWRRITMLFNSAEEKQVRVYAGIWGGKGGKLWLDDWSVEEMGPVNVLCRPGTPVTVRSSDGTATYVEGKDYGPLGGGQLHPWRDDGEPASLKLLPGSAIKEGQALRLSWYHSAIIYDSQVTVCMAEPAIYEIIDHEAKLLAERLHPKKVFLNMDEVRMGGTCRACSGRNMGELVGECVTKQAQILRRHNPGAQIYVWSDMFDPNHNAHGNYYLVKGDFTGSWQHVPKDLVMAVWGGEPREKSVRFFAQEKFPMLIACYYDAEDLKDVKAWLKLSQQSSRVRGMMYTPWEKKYGLLGDFGDLLR
jgi:hypothetical protein